jgi:hypothetical protein
MANIHVKKFNKIIIGFLDELMKILPEEKNIKVFKSQLSTVEFLDEKKIIKSFIQYGYPYKKQILEKDESFFLKEGNVKIEGDYMSEALQLKRLWQTKLSDDNKEVVWKYFKVLVLICEKYMS